VSSAAILAVLTLGLVLELAAFSVLRRVFRLDPKAAALGVALGVLLVYVPWGVLTWPGGDVFAIHLAVFLTAAYVLGMVSGVAGNRRHWAPLLIVGFFIVVIASNVVFLGVAERGITGVFAELLPAPRDGTVANSRFPGTVSHDFQEKEALYNAYLAQVREQQARGWQVQKGWAQPPQVGEPAVFLVEVRDRDGRPISNAEVSGEFLRVSNSAFDFPFHMEATGGGRYRYETRMPLPGIWQLVLHVRRGEALHEVRAHTSIGDAVPEA
jgi:nitrogen fixation protein FixH